MKIGVIGLDLGIATRLYTKLVNREPQFNSSGESRSTTEWIDTTLIELHRHQPKEFGLQGIPITVGLFPAFGQSDQTDARSVRELNGFDLVLIPETDGSVELRLISEWMRDNYSLSDRVKTLEAPNRSDRCELIRNSLKMTRMIIFYTTVGHRCQSWLLPAGSSILQAAGEIHSDLAKGFTQAKVYRVSDAQELGFDRTQLQARHKVLTVGPDYLVQEADVIEIQSGLRKGK